MEKRQSFIDYAKAIGTILVMIGHFTPSGSVARLLIYSFHMPLFFIASGLLLTPANTIKEYGSRLWKVFLRTMIPYLIFYLLSALPFVIAGTLDWTKAVRTLFFLDGKMIWNYALWFLPCYFLSFALFSLLLFIGKGKRLFSGAVAFICLLTAALLYFFGIKVTFLGFEKCLMACGFLAFGHAIKPPLFALAKSKAACLVAIPVFCIVNLVSLFVNFGDSITMLFVDYNQVFFFIPVACVLSLAFMLICALPRPSKFARLFSDCSLFVMCSHMFFRQALYTFFGYSLEIWSGLAITAAVTLFYVLVLWLLSRSIQSQKTKKVVLFIGLKL